MAHWNNIIREPLLHFLFIGVVLFVVFDLFVPQKSANNSSKTHQKIVISKQLQQSLKLQFKNTWKRFPNELELSNLVNEYLREEVYYREALSLGLEQNDTVIRQRLRQKMEFMVQSSVNMIEANDEQLVAYLEKNKATYTQVKKIAFFQIFFKNENSEKQRSSIRRKLTSYTQVDEAITLNQSSVLPFINPLSSKQEIAQSYGEQFSDEIMSAPSGKWIGPIWSNFGEHFVFINHIKAAYLPELGQIRNQVLKNWRYQQAKELSERQFKSYLQEYEVTIEPLIENKANE
ncbi:MAG: peptidylprolyl isomerase [Colwellia sp.]|nr:peptidylprolyl isomerase [Colwellia sp.]MCW8863897.1 peptidylprolyl isomerase [Colwellia sp.]MCW9081179.1 peptidylprolyl isomerase [Colwellia sp.]